MVERSGNGNDSDKNLISQESLGEQLFDIGEKNE